jgi:hypothetical protein
MTDRFRLLVAAASLVSLRSMLVVPSSHAATPPTTATAASATSPVVPSTAAKTSALAATETTRKAHQALRELDRFLDHHPLLEDDLRLTPKLVTESEFLRSNPELREFLLGNPAAVSALALEPRHFLRRALMLQASAPIRWTEIAQLDPLFDQQPELERELERRPELIHDPEFLRSHGKLRDFLVQHPPLARVFLSEKFRDKH